MDPQIVVLAAGKGTRMKSSLPKVLHKICGKPMIYHIIKESLKLTSNIAVIIGHESETVKNALESEFDNLKFFLQDLENLPGTGGAVKSVEITSDRIIILNGDMPLIRQEHLSRLLEPESDLTIGVIEAEDPKGYGRVIINNGEIVKIVEEKDATEEEKRVKSVNSGVYAITRELLEAFLPTLSNDNAQKEYYLTDIVEFAINEGFEVKPVFVDERSFMGVNSKYELSVAEDIMQSRIQKDLMLNGVTIRSPKTVFIEAGVKFEGECEIEPGVVIKGDTFIKSSYIKANSVIEDSKIEFSVIGPFARIRPKSDIRDSTIGNFTEIKKSSLKGVKAGHLSYIGDSEIDEGTNIGAGVITCNYDGKNKHKTVIGKGVFVGSDSQLIAPVTIEDESFIAAGTTVTKNVKSGSLAISRAPLKILDGFYKRFFGNKDAAKK